MAFFDKAHFLWELEQHTLIFLWITAIANVLELIAYKIHFFEVENGFWNLIGISFYLIWTGWAVMFCAAGLGGIDEFRPKFLIYCFRYLLCSAIFKAIFAILLFSLRNDDDLYSVFAYASNEPLLLILTARFVENVTPLTHILFHVMAICYLMCGAFMVHRLGNRMLKRDVERDARIEANNVAENP